MIYYNERKFEVLKRADALKSDAILPSSYQLK